MMNQQTEAARQILGCVSDIQAVVSMCGLDEVNLKLASIREKAAFIYEGAQGPVKILAGYEGDVRASMHQLGVLYRDHAERIDVLETDDLVQLMRISEIFVTRARVCLDRRGRMAEMGLSKSMEDNDAN